MNQALQSWFDTLPAPEGDEYEAAITKWVAKNIKAYTGLSEAEKLEWVAHFREGAIAALPRFVARARARRRAMQ